jgi:hypothetical protein
MDYVHLVFAQYGFFGWAVESFFAIVSVISFSKRCLPGVRL